MSVQDTLDLHPRKFWFLSNQIARLQAEEQIALLQIQGASGSEEAAKVALENLQSLVGQVYVWEEEVPEIVRLEDLDGEDPAFDRKALNAMKQRIASQRR